MTKTTMGEFLAILRKSKGLTQQEAADRLGVSNKTVSSWETGASCPDISMIPALAELYEVTCDEILRGERIPPAEPPQAAVQKREKALSHLLARLKNNVSIAAMVAYGLAILAAILTLTLDFAAFESRLGFFIGLILLIAALFVILLACRRAVFLVSQNEFETEASEEFFRYLFRVRGRGCLVCAASFGFIFPHLFAPAHTGLNAAPAFLLGLYSAAVSFLLAGIIYLFVKSGSRHFPENRRKYLRFKLINGVIIFGIAALISATAITVVSVYGLRRSVMVSNPDMYCYDTIDDLVQDAEGCYLFADDYNYSILREQTLPEEGEGRALVVFLFPSESNNFTPGDFYGYQFVTKSEGIELTLFRYRLEISGEEGKFAEFLAARPEFQNARFHSKRKGVDIILP